MPRSSRLALLLIAACLSGSHGSAQSGADYTEVVQGVPFVMKAIPAGTFQQGCGEADEPCIEEEWADYEAGIRQQSVSVAACYLAETETTWARYQRCIDAGACPDNTADGGDNGWGKGTRPAIEMSWNDITTAFLPWLNRETGGAYRLPTEAEWAYAARAGTTTPYPWGDEADCSKARYGFITEDCGRPTSTVPVKSYPPNAFGLYDMHGNVAEWCLDAFTRDGYAALAARAKDGPRVDPIQWPDELYPRVARGGHWDDDPDRLRSAARRGSTESWKVQDPQLPKSIWYHTDAQWLGFRVVRPLNPPPFEEWGKYHDADLDSVRKIQDRQRAGER